eukprot:5468156-Lingulodinium_polyedra.AAC.1
MDAFGCGRLPPVPTPSSRRSSRPPPRPLGRRWCEARSGPRRSLSGSASAVDLAGAAVRPP